MALPYPCRQIISNKPQVAAEGKMANLLGVGFLRKVVKWALWKMKNVKHDGNVKDKKALEWIL
ncbi:hypothetical protein CCACVL1_13489 [Corchorus capsularis]|uniref:Uncharacterized protein n=1 Tax=Corchorus capsularis TaxID=210143 RepID=A0A1R3IAS6_COCAP|nr:hypothetical protein CCACVL1_13489 [Corchorus capsularis]